MSIKTQSIKLKNMKNTFKFMLALLAIFFAQPSTAEQVFGCLIEPYQVAEVGSQVVGVIESMKVERGDSVKKGQLIAVLRSGVERASVGAANTRAKANANVSASKASYEFDLTRVKRAEELVAKNFISTQALDQIKAETEVSHQKYMQAKEQKSIAEKELYIASSQLSQRSIRSPFDGVITDRYMSLGERIEQKPIVRIAQINRLRALIVVPVSHYGKIKIDDIATITPNFPDAPTVSGRVTLIDKVIDAASNTFRIQVDLENEDLSLPAGLRCKADFAVTESSE